MTENKDQNLYQRYGILLYSILVFSTLSWLATAGGIRIFLPTISEDMPWVNWLVALGISGAIQIFILKSVMGIHDKGLMTRWIVFYLLFASVSITGSYVWLFERWSGGILNAQSRANFIQETNSYHTDTLKLFRQARDILNGAKHELDTLIEIEQGTGGTTRLARGSYVKNREVELQINYSDDPRGGCGDNCKKLQQLARQVRFEESSIAEDIAAVESAGQQDLLTGTNHTDRLARIARAVDDANWTAIT